MVTENERLEEENNQLKKSLMIISTTIPAARDYCHRVKHHKLIPRCKNVECPKCRYDYLIEQGKKGGDW